MLICVSISIGNPPIFLQIPLKITLISNLVLAKPVITPTLHKRESKSNSINNPIYVVASFAGGVVIFVTLFVACCVFSLTQRPSSMTTRPKCFRPSSSLETESLRNSQYDTTEVTELTRLHVEEEKQQQVNPETGFIRIPPDEGYKSMSSNTASTPSSISLMSPPQKPPSPGKGSYNLLIYKLACPQGTVGRLCSTYPFINQPIGIGSITDQEKYLSFFRRDESRCCAANSPASP